MSIQGPHDSRAIANIFVRKAREAGDKLTIMSLLKYVYFAHGWHLGNGLGPLICHKVEAWRFGPVVPEVYHAFNPKGYDVTAPCKGYETPKLEDLPSGAQTVINAVYEQYSRHSALKLSQITHAPEAPWSKYEGIYYAEIPNGEIEEFYRGLVQKANSRENSQSR